VAEWPSSPTDRGFLVHRPPEELPELGDLLEKPEGDGFGLLGAAAAAVVRRGLFL